MPYKGRLEVRLTEEHLEQLKEAAWIRKVSLSQWCRTVLLATAQQTIKEQDERDR